MKNLSRFLLPLAGMLLLAAPIVMAQTQGQSLDDMIKQAKEEASKLETFIQSASPSLRASLQPVLDSRRAVIKDLEALSQLPVKLTRKELDDTVGRLATNSTNGSAPEEAPAGRATTTRDVGTGQTMLCGRLRPASLDNILALLSTELPVFQASFKELEKQKDQIKTAVQNDVGVPDAQKENETDKRIATTIKKMANHEKAYPAILLNTIHNGSRFKSDRSDTGKVCDCEEETVTLGEQKEAVVKLLSWLLNDKNWKDVSSDLSTAASGSSPKLSKEVVRRQITQLNQYLGNVTIQLKTGDDTATAITDRDGNFLFKNITIAEDSDPQLATLSTEGDDNYTKREFYIKAGEQVRLDLPIEDRPVSLMARAVVGYQQAGAAATDNEQNYFFDIFLSTSLPFRQRISPDFGEKWRTWGAIRAISVPNTDNFTIGDAASSFVTRISALRVQDAARVFDYQGGIEYRIAGNNALLPSFDRQTKQKFSLSLIGSFGFVTPTNPLEMDPPVFVITPQLKAALLARGLLTGKADDPNRDKTFAAFVPDDRDRFFRQYYGGIRLQTHFFNRYNVPMQRFPAQFDFTFGQNEYVTGGRFRGSVFRFDGYFPLPYEGLKFINLLGTAIIKPSRVKITSPLILKAADGIKPFDDSVLLVPVSQFNRDYYRVGVGMDFLSFIQKLLNRN